ncbi:MAG: DUF481 domain-containing protein [Chitinophagaceae bacterium]|nr:DUF481 domain-containing protein [Chitinophagaceae bacterium]MBL0056144.1 DUF481 domain-containing protein [Chitinophagaceae bacterium]
MQSDTTGWMGNAGAYAALTKNNEQIFSANADAHLQYKSAKSLYLILGNYGFLKGAGKSLINYSFFHLRYNYKLNPVIRWEIFTQLQQNKITGIQSRFLAGTGPRFKVFSTPLIRLYAATLFMYEYEKETTPDARLHKDFRNSSYISFTITPGKNLEIISTSFFQPIVNNWTDHRFLNQISLRVQAGKKLGIRINWDYLNDSKPVPGNPSENYKLSTGIDYDF